MLELLELLWKLINRLMAAPTSVLKVARAILPVCLVVKAIYSHDVDVHHPFESLQGSYAGGRIGEDEP